jgi:hypothetical protein
VLGLLYFSLLPVLSIVVFKMNLYLVAVGMTIHVVAGVDIGNPMTDVLLKV